MGVGQVGRHQTERRVTRQEMDGEEERRHAQRDVWLCARVDGMVYARDGRSIGLMMEPGEHGKLKQLERDPRVRAPVSCRVEAR